VTPQDFFAKALPEARSSGHIFPEYACCEVALETGWGGSSLTTIANNLFGQKQGAVTAGLPTVQIQTREFLNGQWVVVPATWPKFASWSDSFKARMQLLRTLAPKYPNYAAALAATTGEDFIRSVSKTWSTDPQRADKVLQIYNAHLKGAAAAAAATTTP